MMFESNMDEYLDEEIESLKQAFELICKEWARSVRASLPTPDSLCSMPHFQLADISACITWLTHASTTDSLPYCAEPCPHEA